MPTTVNNAVTSIKQQLDGIAKLTTQTNLDGANRVARFRRTIDLQPRASIKAKHVDLAAVAKVKDAPEVDVVQNIQKIIDNMNNYMHNLNKMVRFDLDRQAGRFVVRAIDYGQGKEIAQFPVSAMLKAHAQINAIKISDGLFVHRIPWLIIDKQA